MNEEKNQLIPAPTNEQVNHFKLQVRSSGQNMQAALITAMNYDFSPWLVFESIVAVGLHSSKYAAEVRDKYHEIKANAKVRKEFVLGKLSIEAAYRKAIEPYIIPCRSLTHEDKVKQGRQQIATAIRTFRALEDAKFEDYIRISLDEWRSYER